MIELAMQLLGAVPAIEGGEYAHMVAAMCISVAVVVMAVGLVYEVFRAVLRALAQMR